MNLYKVEFKGTSVRDLFVIADSIPSAWERGYKVVLNEDIPVEDKEVTNVNLTARNYKSDVNIFFSL